MVDFVAIMKEMKLKKGLNHNTAVIEQTEVTLYKDKEDSEDFQYQISDLSPRHIIFDGLNNTSVVILENISGTWRGGNGATIWDSSIVLTQYLLDNQMNNLSESRILELGSGLGLPTITLSKIDKCQVTASERPIMMDILRENCCYNFRLKDSKYWQHKQSQNLGSEILNGSLSNLDDSDEPGHSTIPALLSLDWKSSDNLNQLADMSFDYVIGADLLFASNRDTWEGLADIFKTLLKSSESESNLMKESKKKKLGWLAYEPRDSFVFEEFFNVLLKERGVFYERVTSAITVIPHDIHIFLLYCE
jgi:predicted nicotinamide N-methyase